MNNLRLFAVANGFLLAFSIIAFAQEAKNPSEEYAKMLVSAASYLAAGQTEAASKLLVGAKPELRSFEHAYLSHRAKQANSADELLKRVAKPDVEQRYGLLDAHRRRVVFLCRDGSLRIYDLAAPEREMKKVEHAVRSAVWSGAFSFDGKRFFSGHEDGSVVIWDPEDWRQIRLIELGAKWPVRELAPSPTGDTFVAETEKGLDHWLAGEDAKRIANIGPRYNFGEGLAFSPKGDIIAVGGMFDIQLIDAKTAKTGHTLRHASYTMGLEFSPDGTRIASAPRGNVNKFLAVFEKTADKPLFNAGPFGNYISGMAFTPDGKRILATGCEKQVRLFDAATGKVLYSWKRTECSTMPRVSADGRLVGWNEPDGFYSIDLGSRP